MRWVVRSLVALLLLIALAGVGLVLIPKERIARIATDEFSRMTGRALVIEGSVRPTLWPVLGVKTGPVTLANAEWGSAPEMLRAEGLSIGLDLAALIAGNVRITELAAQSPHILLERHKDGRGNWQFEMPASGTGTGSPSTVTQGFTMDRAAIRDGTLRFIDHAAKQEVVLSDISLDTAVPDFAGPVRMELSAAMNGQELAVDGTVQDFARFLDGKVVPLDLSAQVGAARIALDGRGGFDPLMAEGALKADLTDLPALARLAGQTPPALPDGFGKRKLTVEGGLTLTREGSLHLRGASVVADDLTITGEADLITAGERPKLTAKLATGDVVVPETADAAPKAAQGAGWSKARIDGGALAALDAEVALNARSLDLGSVKLGAARMLITLDRARAVFQLREAAAYQGRITGQFVLNARKGLSVGGDLQFAGLAMQPLLSDLAGYDRLIGTGDVSVKFLGVGDSLDAIMHSLSGEGLVRFGKGELRGLDIAGMLRTLDPSHVGEGAKTIFDSLSASFTIKDGVAQSDDLAVAAPLFTSGGAGTVSLAGQSLNYRLLPRLLPGKAGANGLEVPILIKGPWADPKVRLDLDWLKDQKLTQERARLEAEAKRKLEEKAREELGVVTGEGESLEDAAKRRAQEALEQEAARALNKLLGGN